MHRYTSRSIGKLDRIAENIDENLFEFHIVANVVIRYTTDNHALIFQSFFITLRHDHCIDLFQHIPERELLFL